MFERLRVPNCLGLRSGWPFALCIAACTSEPPRVTAQYEAVAKEWSLALRAHQIVPLYPLSSDLRPGDVLLIDNSLASDEYSRVWGAGYLPIHLRIGQLSPSVSPQSDPQVNSLPDAISGADADVPLVESFVPGSTSQPLTPRSGAVSFPAFTFEVGGSQQLQAKLPLESIQLGLSYLGSASATASISIAGARVEGLDLVDLLPAIRDWALANREMLMFVGIPRDHVRLKKIRVVSSVYAAERIIVTLRREADANVTVEGTISDIVGLPSVAVIAKTKNSISLSETFSPALVIGYRAIDIPILRDGMLGGFEVVDYQISDDQAYRDSRAFISLARSLSNLIYTYSDSVYDDTRFFQFAAFKYGSQYGRMYMGMVERGRFPSQAFYDTSDLYLLEHIGAFDAVEYYLFSRMVGQFMKVHRVLVETFREFHDTIPPEEQLPGIAPLPSQLPGVIEPSTEPVMLNQEQASPNRSEPQDSERDLRDDPRP